MNVFSSARSTLVVLKVISEPSSHSEPSAVVGAVEARSGVFHHGYGVQQRIERAQGFRRIESNDGSPMATVLGVEDYRSHPAFCRR